MRLPIASWVVLAVFLSASLLGCNCGDDDDDDAAPDSGTDAGFDSGLDAGVDAGPDCRSILTVVGTYDLQADAVVPAGCWLVEEDLWVSEGALLTIEPGARLLFSPEAGLEIESDGALSAIGTEQAPVEMTGLEEIRGAWNGLTFTNSDSTDNALSWVEIAWAGGREMQDSGGEPFRAALSLDSSGYEVRASVSNCTVRQSAGYGFYMDDTAVVPDFTGNTFTGNATGAGMLYAAAVHNLSDASTYVGNDIDLVWVNAAYEFGEQDRAWDALDVPYTLDGIFMLYQHLTLAPGMTILFTPGAVLQVMNDLGGLTAEGTVDAPIVLSGVDPTPGSWGGLYFANTNDADPDQPRSRLAHVTIEHGGSYSFNDGNAVAVQGNLMLDSSGWPVAVALDDSTLQHGTGWGAWLSCEANLPGAGTTFDDNAWGDIGREDNCD